MRDIWSLVGHDWTSRALLRDKVAFCSHICLEIRELRILFNTITVPVLRPISYETRRTLGLFITLSPGSFGRTGILHVAMQIGLYHHPSYEGVRRVVSEGSICRRQTTSLLIDCT